MPKIAQTGPNMIIYKYNRFERWSGSYFALVLIIIDSNKQKVERKPHLL